MCASESQSCWDTCGVSGEILGVLELIFVLKMSVFEAFDAHVPFRYTV